MIYDVLLLFDIISLRLNIRKSPGQIEKIRERQFRKIIKYAYRKSPFYRKLYSDSGIRFEDLDHIPVEKIPSIDKDMVIENQEAIVTRKDINVQDAVSFAYKNRNPLMLFNGKYQIVQSSGSSGKSGIFIYSLREMTKAFSCSSRMHLFELGKRNKVAYYAGIDGRFGGVSLVLYGKMGYLKKMYDICLIDMNEPLEKVINTLNNFQPDILIGYGTGLAMLAGFQKEGRLRINPRIIENGGEGLSDNDYNLITRVFNVPIVNMYAASECYFLGIGKEEYDGIYLMDDFNYIEIMEDHILVTNLYNYTQPLIRYRINDKLILKNDNNKLLPFRLVGNLVGREEMLLWFRNEKGVMDYIHPVVLTSFCVEGIEKFQIVLKSENSFEFLAIIPDAGKKQQAIEEVKSSLNAILDKKEMSNVIFSLSIIDQPIIDKNTRKFKMIMKNY
jgi:phenylacetate-CoA ligase